MSARKLTEAQRRALAIAVAPSCDSCGRQVDMATFRQDAQGRVLHPFCVGASRFRIIGAGRAALESK